MNVLAAGKQLTRTNTTMKLPNTASHSEPRMDAAIEEIATRILKIETLEVHSDGRDLHERHVTALKDALRGAYMRGFIDGIAARYG